MDTDHVVTAALRNENFNLTASSGQTTISRLKNRSSLIRLPYIDFLIRSSLQIHFFGDDLVE